MRKQFLLIALAGLTVLAACNKQKESQGVAQFTATIEHQGGRTILDPNNGQINWMAGDQVVIGNDNGETAVFTLQSGEGTTEGGFGTPDDFNTVGPFIAAYPETATIANDVVTFNLPAIQTIGETGTFASGANPMVACSDDKNLQFKNLCGGLGIRLKGVGAHVSAVRITSRNTTEKLWGAYEVSNCAADEPTLTEAANNQGTNVITLTCDVTLTTAAKTFFVMLPPGTLANGFTMEVLDGDEVLATKETTSDVALVERNNVKVFNEILIDMEFDGNVEIPAGMSNSDIVVTNFNEDAVPDESGDFYIGYSKFLIAKNATNGEIVYYCVNSRDENIRSSLENDYELNAKETAITIAMRMLPITLGSCSDEVLHAMKDALYSLQQVKALETAIHNAVNTHGYLKEEVLNTAIESLKLFFDNEFRISGEDLKANSPQVLYLGESGQREVTINPPRFYPEKMHGTMFKIESYQHFTNPEYWRIKCTGYNGLAACFGVIPGHVDMEHPNPDGSFDFDYDHQAPLYYLPPAGLSRGIDILTLGDWDGLKQMIIDIGHKFTDSHYEPLFDKADLEDMYFNINQGINVLAVLACYEDYRIMMANVLYMIFDAVNVCVSFGDNFMQLMISEFINDADYVSMFFTELNNGEEGFRAILEATSEKFYELATTGVLQGLVQTLVQKVGDLAEAISGLSQIAHIGDYVLKFVTWVKVDSFGLPIIAEYNNNFALPDLITNSFEVLSSTQATVTGALINEGTHGIAERGICFGTTSNPTLEDNYVVAEGTGIGAFTCTLEGLSPYTTYYARSYAKNNMGNVGYGSNEVSFRTYSSVPVITTYPVNETDITSTTVAFHAKVDEVPSSTIWMRGFFYSTSPQVYYEMPGVLSVDAMGGGTGEFSATATGLTPGTTYYFVPYVITYDERVFHGPEMHFNTLSGGPQTFTITTMTYPVNSGLTSGDGTYDQGQSCTVTATAISGYTFTCWMENGDVVSTEASYTFTVNSNRTLVANFTANGGGGGSHNCHDYVDLGLPSGLLWATCNVGANAPEEYGDYFAWGETQPKNSYTWDTYSYSDYDAAAVNWGGNWRMPTQVEFQELLDNTTITWTTQNGVNGRLFTAANGNSLFLPAAGYRWEDELEHAGDLGYYWSSSLRTNYPYWAWCISFSSGSIGIYWDYRFDGQSVRPVLEN